MWLRDSLPTDVKGIRIFSYGYDTVIPNSTSFQDLEALAATFRRSLLALRRRLPVSGSSCRHHRERRLSLPLTYACGQLQGCQGEANRLHRP